MYSNKKNNTLEDQIVRNVFHLYPILRNRILKSRDFTQDADIQLPHAQILLELSESESLSVTQLSKHTGIAMPNITPIIDKLCTLQYVNRHHSKNDRRIVEISIMPEGLSCIQRIKDSICEQVFHQDTHYSEAQLSRLNDAMLTILKFFPIE